MAETAKDQVHQPSTQQPEGQQPPNQQVPQQNSMPDPEEAQGGFFRGDDAQQVGSDIPDNVEINWLASEFIHHDKSASWYFGLLVITAAAAAAIYYVTKDIVSSVVVIFAAFFLAYFGSHKPRQLEYKIDSKGVTVGGKFYSFSDFRSFSLVPEGAFNSIVFMPLKRFAVPLSIYYDPKAETQIIDVLKNCLPFEPGKLDMSEKLMRKIRF